jgi:hypothetical protein
VGISLQKIYEITHELLARNATFAPRAFLRFFHQDEPTSSHCSLRFRTADTLFANESESQKSNGMTGIPHFSTKVA